MFVLQRLNRAGALFAAALPYNNEGIFIVLLRSA